MPDNPPLPEALEKLKACSPACQKLLRLQLPEGAHSMTAEEIRKSFIQPELDHLAKEGSLDARRSIALASWELAAQLAELNARLATLGDKAKA